MTLTASSSVVGVVTLIVVLMCGKRRDSVARGVWEVGGATELPSPKKEKRQSKPVRSYMELPMPLT